MWFTFFVINADSVVLKMEEATRPIKIVIFDMTIFKNNGRSWEWTLLAETFNNEILAHQVTPITGRSTPYYHRLEVLKDLAGKKNEELTP